MAAENLLGIVPVLGFLIVGLIAFLFEVRKTGNTNFFDFLVKFPKKSMLFLIGFFLIGGVLSLALTLIFFSVFVG
jgi:hypothetical protein